MISLSVICATKMCSPIKRFSSNLFKIVFQFMFVYLFLSLLYSPFFQADSISSFYFCLAGFMIARTYLWEENQENNKEKG